MLGLEAPLGTLPIAVILFVALVRLVLLDLVLRIIGRRTSKSGSTIAA